MECDVAVLGGGPGGYPAAIRAAQLGASVVLIEQGRVGGTCITVGCIPTKTWVQTAHALKEARETFAQIGVRVSDPELDFGQAQKNKTGIVDGLVNGITGVVKANGITIVNGRGAFTGPNTIAVEGGEDVTFRSAVIATGSHSLRPPVHGHRRPGVRRLDRPARDRRGAAAAGDPRRRRDRRRVRLDLPPLRHRGDDRRDARAPDPDGGRRRLEGARAGVQAARDRDAPGRARDRGRRVGDGGVTLRFEGADGKARAPSTPTWCWSRPAAGRTRQRHRPRPARASSSTRAAA